MALLNEAIDKWQVEDIPRGRDTLHSEIHITILKENN